MSQNLYLLAFITFILSASGARAQSDSLPSLLTPADRPINFYLLDVPGNFHEGYQWPSLTQSIHNTTAVHQLVNTSLQRALEPVHKTWGKVLAGGSIGIFNVFYSYLPTGTAWQHQEAHRAVLRSYGIDSYNQANDFRLFEKRIATNQVLDQDLIDLKFEHPAEFIRNRGLGHESQLEMTEQLKKDAFFFGTRGYADAIPNLLNTYVVISYVNEFRKEGYDKAIDDRNKEELTPDVRDISGVEFTPWVYDLFRPFEPYYDSTKTYGTGVGTRGPHPYGTGVDRYVGIEDLTPEELAYLKKESNLVWLNLLSPHNFGFTRFRATNPFNSQPMYWNVGVVHNLVAFGHVIDFNFFFQQKKLNLFFQYHNYKNKENYFPGATIEVYRYPVGKVFLSGAIGGWSQPKLQMFSAQTGTVGGLFKLGVASRISNKLEWYIDADMKSDGWVSGYLALKPQSQLQFGINWKY